MNILKAADDIKNFSDQQLLSAGENPVMLPPYLVLAEMKRREQMRAEFAKSQQQQQPPTVIQQTAQNLAQSQQQQGQPQQGQPQQGMPQQPQAQGIMQGAPQQVMAMASGGYVPRYAAGTPKPNSIEQLMGAVAQSNQDLASMSQQRNDYRPPSSLFVDPKNVMGQFEQRNIKDYLSKVDELQGQREYSPEQRLVDYQIQMAEKNKPRLGDALIAAGAAMASNRDNRVGLANILAQSIGVGSQTYDAARKNQDEARKAAMAGQVALGRMKQDDFQKRVATAIHMSEGDINKSMKGLEISQANLRFAETQRQKATSEQDRRRFEALSAIAKNNTDVYTAAVQIQGSADVARINADSRMAAAKIGADRSVKENNYGFSNPFEMLKQDEGRLKSIYESVKELSPSDESYISQVKEAGEIRQRLPSLRLLTNQQLKSGGKNIRMFGNPLASPTVEE